MIGGIEIVIETEVDEMEDQPLKLQEYLERL